MLKFFIRMNKKQNQAKKILHVIHGGCHGGIETVVSNYYQHIDKTKYEFDFVFHSEKRFDFHKGIENLGGKIFYCPTLGNGYWNYFKTLKDIIKKNGKYDAIHIHTGHQAGFVGFVSLISGIKIRICHSHNITIENIIYQKLFPLWKLLIFIFCNRYIACSSESGKTWFNKTEYELLPNAIDFNKYQNIDLNERELLRAQLSISSGSLILGHAGRFVNVKNHDFLIKLMVNLKTIGVSNIHMVLAGDGPLLEEIKKKTNNYNLEKNIHFLGHFINMPTFWNSVDIMLLPSYNEGFPLVFVEAQATGIYSIISEGLRDVADSGFGNYDVCRLDNIDNWINKIIGYKKLQQKSVPSKSIYNINYSVKRLEQIYLEFFNEAL